MLSPLDVFGMLKCRFFMAEVFVRFVTAVIDEESGRRRGVFQAIADLLESNELSAHDRIEVNACREWFNQQLERPTRFSRSFRKNAASKAISWYKTDAVEHISRMHAMCHYLNEYVIVTEMMTTHCPGYIVFEDQHQIVAMLFTDTSSSAVTRTMLV
jgi:hypothetical protein